MSKIHTVGDLRAALARLPHDLPVMAGCHYDNDDALTDEVTVTVGPVEQIDGEFHMWADPTSPGATQAAVIS